MKDRCSQWKYHETVTMTHSFRPSQLAAPKDEAGHGNRQIEGLREDFSVFRFMPGRCADTSIMTTASRRAKRHPGE